MPTTNSSEATVREVEAKLIVVGEPAAGVLRDLAAQPRIGDYALSVKPEKEIRDRYFDTESGDLRRADLALRIRDVGPARTLTLKGSARRRGSAIERIEVEHAWSREGLGAALATLSAHGVRTPATLSRVDALCPERTLAQLGFGLIQKRQTARIRRAITASADDELLGELALDHVTYRWRALDVHHYEVEIEAADPDSFDALEDLVREVRQRYPQTLRPWPHGKVDTGRALEQLLATPDWRALLYPNGSPRAAAYDAIAAVLAA